MKKQELLKAMDGALLEKLYGFCYARTKDSYEAQELCSDIVYALVKAAGSEGEIENIFPYIWRVARNVYAHFSEMRSRYVQTFLDCDETELLCGVAGEEPDDSEEKLAAVYREISFLTKAYRSVMIMYYLDGFSTAQIARIQNVSETAVRQRLFSARKKIRNEVEEMKEDNKKPVALDTVEYSIWGSGNPAWGDPREVCTRQLSKHIVWLCREKPMRASDIAEELNVPTVYVEEELEILASGTNGAYGLLRRVDKDRYAINFILLDERTIGVAQEIYGEQMPGVCDSIAAFVEEHREEYLGFPYLNRKVDINLIMWQQISVIADIFRLLVEKVLAEKHFADAGRTERPFSVFGHVDDGRRCGFGCDGVNAVNVCGYSEVHLENIYNKWIQKHFHCGWNVAQDFRIQMALRAVGGLEISRLSEAEKEHVAEAVRCGYLYREQDMLYTKILVSDRKDMDRLFGVSYKVNDGRFQAGAEKAAERIAALIRKTVPEYLLPEWRFFNQIAGMPVTDAAAERLIQKGILHVPEDGIGAEGCWMCVAQ